jgi:hypothetical protein
MTTPRFSYREWLSLAGISSMILVLVINGTIDFMSEELGLIL